MKHTKGPWNVDIDKQTKVFRIMQVGANEGLAITGTKANASLIAAAPEMLESLEVMHAWVTDMQALGCIKSETMRDELKSEMNRMQDVIKKAKGGE